MTESLYLPLSLRSSYDMAPITGIMSTLDASLMANPLLGIKENSKMLTKITMKIKDVPQR